MTSLPWPPASTYSSNCISHRSRGLHAHRTPYSSRSAAYQAADDVPVLHDVFTIQQVTHIELRMLDQLGYDLASLTPMVWVDIFRRRFSLRWQQLRPQGNFLTRHLHSQSGRRDCLARVCAPFVAAQRVRGAVNALPAWSLAQFLRPATSLYLVAPTFCFCLFAVSFLCALVTLHNSHSSQLSCVEIVILISTIGARDWVSCTIHSAHDMTP